MPVQRPCVCNTALARAAKASSRALPRTSSINARAEALCLQRQEWTAVLACTSSHQCPCRGFVSATLAAPDDAHAEAWCLRLASIQSINARAGALYLQPDADPRLVALGCPKRPRINARAEALCLHHPVMPAQRLCVCDCRKVRFFDAHAEASCLRRGRRCQCLCRSFVSVTLGATTSRVSRPCPCRGFVSATRRPSCHAHAEASCLRLDADSISMPVQRLRVCD